MTFCPLAPCPRTVRSHACIRTVADKAGIFCGADSRPSMVLLCVYASRAPDAPWPDTCGGKACLQLDTIMYVRYILSASSRFEVFTVQLYPLAFYQGVHEPAGCTMQPATCVQPTTVSIRRSAYQTLPEACIHSCVGQAPVQHATWRTGLFCQELQHITTRTVLYITAYDLCVIV